MMNPNIFEVLKCVDISGVIGAALSNQGVKLYSARCVKKCGAERRRTVASNQHEWSKWMTATKDYRDSRGGTAEVLLWRMCSRCGYRESKEWISCV